MISFIIVNFKSIIELKRCLTDLEKVPNSDSFDVIIINNDVEKIHIPTYQFKQQRIYEVNKNIGYARANNIGLDHAENEIVCFLNPDTYSFDEKLPSIIKHLDNQTIVSPQILSDDGTPQKWSSGHEINLFYILKNNFGIYKKPWQKTKKISVHWVTGAALFIKKDLMKKLGGFDESFFLYFEDADLCKRLRDIYGKIYYIPEIKIKHSSGSSSKETRKFQKKCYYKSQDIFFKKHVSKTQALFLRIFRFFHR